VIVVVFAVVVIVGEGWGATAMVLEFWGVGDSGATGG